MKKVVLTLSAASLFAFGFSSCKKVKDALGLDAFEITVPTVAFNPIAETSANQSVSTSATVNFNLDSAIKAHTGGVIGISKVTSVKVKNATLTVTNSDSQNDASNFQNVIIGLSANNNSTEVINASIPDVATSSVVVNGNNTEIKSYLSASSLTYNVASVTRKSITKPLNITAGIVLTVQP